MAIELHARWLRDGKTKAGEMLMANGEPLPVDLVPVCKEAKAVTGAEAMEELRRILRHARASGVEVVRFIDSREAGGRGTLQVLAAVCMRLCCSGSLASGLERLSLRLGRNRRRRSQFSSARALRASGKRRAIVPAEQTKSSRAAARP